MLNIIKVLISAITIVLASEVAKRSSFWGALIIVLPINSIISLVLFYADGKSSSDVANYAKEIFFLVPLSLLFFLPFLFASKTNWPFSVNMGLGIMLLGASVLLTAAFKKAF